MVESRIRSGRKSGYVVIFRSAAQDSRLSLEARGLLAMMLSLPENWEYSVSGLAQKAGCGKSRVRRLLDELERVGYLVREQTHDAGGRFSGNIYAVQDEAPPLSENCDNGEAKNPPLSENTDDGIYRQRETPSSENRTQKNKDLKETEREKNPPKSPQGGKRRKYELDDSAKPILRQYAGEDRELAWALADLIEVRTKIRAVNSEKAIKRLLRELDRLSEGDRDMKLRIITQSVINSWRGVFPLKQAAGTFQPIREPVFREEIPTW